MPELAALITNSLGDDQFFDGRMESVKVILGKLTAEEVYLDYKESYIE